MKSLPSILGMAKSVMIKSIEFSLNFRNPSKPSFATIRVVHSFWSTIEVIFLVSLSSSIYNILNNG